MRLLLIALVSVSLVVGCSVSHYDNNGGQNNRSVANHDSGDWATLTPAEVLQQGDFTRMCKESGFVPVSNCIPEDEWYPQIEKLRADGMLVNGMHFYHLQVRIKGNMARYAFILDLARQLPVGQAKCTVPFASHALACGGMIVAFNEAGSSYQVTDGWKDHSVKFSSDPKPAYYSYYKGNAVGPEQERLDAKFSSQVLFLTNEGDYRGVYRFNFSEIPADVKKVYVLFGANAMIPKYVTIEIDVNGDVPDDHIVVRTIELR